MIIFTVSMGLKCISQIITGSLLINDHIYNINGAKCISQIITGSLIINDNIYSIYGAKMHISDNNWQLTN